MFAKGKQSCRACAAPAGVVLPIVAGAAHVAQAFRRSGVQALIACDHCIIVNNYDATPIQPCANRLPGQLARHPSGVRTPPNTWLSFTSALRINGSLSTNVESVNKRHFHFQLAESPRVLRRSKAALQI